MQKAEHDTIPQSESGTAQDAAHVGDLQAFDSYRRRVGRSKTTFWRYRRQGWLPTVNIFGRLYLTRAAIEEFEAAAKAGALASEPTGCAAAHAFAKPGTKKWRAQR
jgi:hypothetical protein